MNPSDIKKLIGKWSIDPQDTKSLEIYGDTTLEFKEDGMLIYTIHETDKEQKMFLTYKVKDGVLITDQPSAPRIEETPYRLIDGKLILIYDNHEARYIQE